MCVWGGGANEKRREELEVVGLGLAICATVITCGGSLYCIVDVIDDVLN